MEKFILIETSERDIASPCVFDSHEEAHKEMCGRFADAIDMDADDVIELYVAGKTINDDAGLSADNAYCDMPDRDNGDWAIFTIQV